ncbi:MAG: hypothetical protein HYZ34_13330, partial [Ignavibacteriae bacterium]|nr:hypothetical protein [Ignavibacteriota bacterium]
MSFDFVLTMRRLIIVTIVFGILMTVSFSQTLLYDIYGTRDGLPSDEINTLFQDSQGFLWIGTLDGLTKYDSKHFINYTTGDGIFSTEVHNIWENKSHPQSLWLFIDEGICQFSNGEFTPPKTSPISSRITAALQDKEGIIWSSTEHGIEILTDDNFTQMSVTPSPRLCNQIIEGDDSLLWFLSFDGLWYYSRIEKRFSHFLEVEPAETFPYGSAMCLDDKNDLWVATHTGEIVRIRNSQIIDKRNVRYGKFTFIVDDHERSMW